MTMQSRKLFTLATAVLTVLALVAVAAPQAEAQAHRTYNVTVTNLTRGQVISPPLAVSHSRHMSLWEVGSPASTELVGIAEDAMYGPMTSLLESSPQVADFAMAAAPLPPGQSVTLQVDASFPFNQVSVLGMLVTTNDAFFGAEIPELPFRFMKDEYYAPAYDAGSEANTENCAEIPGPPCENIGVRVTDGAEGFVHVHAGVQGTSDLVPAMHDWRNPVAKVTIQIDR